MTGQPERREKQLFSLSEEKRREREKAIGEVKKLIETIDLKGISKRPLDVENLGSFSERPLEVRGKEGEYAIVTLVVGGKPLEVYLSPNDFGLKRETGEGMVSFRFNRPLELIQLHLEAGEPKLLFRIKESGWLGVSRSIDKGKVNVCFGPSQQSLWLDL